MYDIGAPYRGSLKSFPRTKRAFSLLKPNLVIISHWDADHYIGCGYASDDVFNVKWIAPQLIKGENCPINLFRLVAFLMATKKIMLIDRNNAGKLVASIGNNVINLRMGISKVNKTENITPKNRTGLYVEFGENNGKISVLAGDVPYSSMDTSIFSKQLIFLRVPHHCSKMDTSSLQQSKWGEKAVISTNNKSSSGNPNVDNSHRQVLVNRFNSIYYTSKRQGQGQGHLLSIRLRKDGSVIER